VPSLSCVSGALLERALWCPEGGGISDTSSEAEEIEPSLAPPRPLLIRLQEGPRLTAAYALWDLLQRPDGISLPRLRRLFEFRHGSLPRDWRFTLWNCPLIELFLPHRRRLAPLTLAERGTLFFDIGRVVGAEVVLCSRPGPLGCPASSTPEQGREAVARICDELMLQGGAAGAAGFQSLLPAYASAAADSQREQELERVVDLLERGQSVHVRCTAACDAARRAGVPDACHGAGVVVALRARLAARLSRAAPRPRSLPKPRAHPDSASRTIFHSGTGEAVLVHEHAAIPLLPFFRGQSIAYGMPAAQFDRHHARRVVPPVPSLDGAIPSPRLRAAVSQDDVPQPPTEAALRIAHAGAAEVPVVPRYDPPARFSHRRLERQSDAESLAVAPVITNTPVVAPVEPSPPDDQPERVALALDEVLTRNCIRAIRTWMRRARRSVSLGLSGDVLAAKTAKPPDLRLRWQQNTRPAFRGVVMDFTTYPFRSLQPTRWPDRPPSTDLDIRAIRREFRAHPDFTDRWLRGAISHGNPAVGACPLESYFAAPHASAYVQAEQWQRQVAKERQNGWGRAGFNRSLGLISWPERLAPTSMVERKGNWRLCHDLSWPRPPSESDDDAVVSPNTADFGVLVVVFVQLGQLCMMVAIMAVAGVIVLVWKFDLSKAYKRTGQQRATTWYRTYLGDEGPQTLDRVAFGQKDGPSSFSRQSSFGVFVINRELDYADQCYPTQDPALRAWQLARFSAATAQGAAEPSAWMRLFFVLCFIDDYGGASFDDLLFRADLSPVYDSRGQQRRRASLHFDVSRSVLERFGHYLEDEPEKMTHPSTSMVLLGGQIDVVAEELLLDPTKRRVYADALDAFLSPDGLSRPISPARLMSLAFKLLVVCETAPYARQWLHSAFRALRRRADVQLQDEAELREDFQRFLRLLRGESRIAVPFACRQSFPFANQPELVVKYDDASGDDSQNPFAPPTDGVAGYGGWFVRGRTLFFYWGLWTAEELRLYHITVLEAVISFWSLQLAKAAVPEISHVLEFTDNTGAEWLARRESPHAPRLQRVSARRTDLLLRLRIFARTLRVASKINTWADDLSRQRVAKVLREAAALGLRAQRLHIPADMRDLSWLS
jgi:hypothetical protein